MELYSHHHEDYILTRDSAGDPWQANRSNWRGRWSVAFGRGRNTQLSPGRSPNAATKTRAGGISSWPNRRSRFRASGWSPSCQAGHAPRSNANNFTRLSIEENSLEAVLDPLVCHRCLRCRCRGCSGPHSYCSNRSTTSVLLRAEPSGIASI